MQRRPTIFILSFLVLATALVFGQVGRHEFVNWDDNILVYQNAYLEPIAISKVADLWQHPHAKLYMPVTYSTWAAIALFAHLPHPLATPGGNF